MTESILRRIRGRFEDRQTTLVRRGSATDDRDYGSLLSAHVLSSVDKLTRGLRDTSIVLDSVDEERHVSSAVTQARLQMHLEDLLTKGIAPNRTFDLVIYPGSVVFAPPYDKEWQEGRGLAFGAKSDGNFLTMQPNPGETSGAGVGLIIQSSTLADASIMPQGGYKTSIFSVSNQSANAWSMGGLAVTIYNGGNPSPEISRIIPLWSITNIHQWFGLTLEGQIADATSVTAPGPFPYRLVDFTLRMEPNVPYLVWIWAWQTGNVPDGNGFLALSSVTMPAVTISAGPPVVIH